MEITQVKIRRLYSEHGRLKAKVSIVIDEVLAIHDLHIIDGPSRLFVSMPSRFDANGGHLDVVHPIGEQTRQQIEDAVLSEYYRAVAVQELEEHPEAMEPTSHNF